MTPAPTAGSFTHNGVEYDVIDWHFVGVHRKRVELNSRHAEGRAFVPKDHTKQVRIYLFRGGINYQMSDDATLAQQFKASEPGRWKR